MSVTLATPCYGGLVHARTAGAIAYSVAALAKRNQLVTWITTEGESLIPRARNVLVRRFLAGGTDRLVFIDGDIAFQPRDLLTLLDVQEDVVGATYPKKKPGHPELVVERMNGATKGDLVEVRRIGTGFLSISRDALERMVEAHPEWAYRSPTEGVMHALFDTALVDGAYLSEDWLFCDRWRALGGRVWMHDGIRLGHIGATTYGGSE